MGKVLGLDIGYGYTKVCVRTDDNKYNKYMFPTVVSQYVSSGNFNPSPTPIEFAMNGGPYEKYFIGDELMSSTYGHFEVKPDFVNSNEYYAIISYILNKEKDVDVLVLGLPPAVYDRGKTNRYIENIKKLKIKTNGSSIVRIPEKIEYIPQGAGIFFAYVAGRRSELYKNTVVIDVGHYTLDLVLFVNGKYVSGFAQSYPLGVKTLLTEVRNMFAKKYDTLINSDAAIATLIKTGKVVLFDKEYEFDASEITEKFYSEQIQNILSSYANRLMENNIQIGNIILGGGGVGFVNAKNAIVINDAQFGNARGFCEYGRALL